MIDISAILESFALSEIALPLRQRGFILTFSIGHPVMLSIQGALEFPLPGEIVDGLTIESFARSVSFDPFRSPKSGEYLFDHEWLPFRVKLNKHAAVFCYSMSSYQDIGESGQRVTPIDMHSETESGEVASFECSSLWLTSSVTIIADGFPPGVRRGVTITVASSHEDLSPLCCQGQHLHWARPFRSTIEVPFGRIFIAIDGNSIFSSWASETACVVFVKWNSAHRIYECEEKGPEEP